MSSSRAITIDFAYHRPATLEEALSLLASLPEARILAGGTDLLNQIKLGEARPAALIHVLDIPELARLELRGGLTIGGAVALYRLEEEPLIAERYPALHEAVRALASVQIRTMATLAGNLCNASPSADTCGPLLVLGAEAEIAGLERGRLARRRLPLEQFFTGPGSTVLRPAELLVAVHVPEPAAHSGSAFLRLARVSLDIAKVSASAFMERAGDSLRSVRLAIGGAAPRPVRAHAVEKELAGRPFSRNALQRAVRRVEQSISPITDVRSTAEYRRAMAAVLLRDACLEAWKRSGGEGQA